MKMDTPRTSRFISNKMAQVRSKLPLYSNNKPENVSQPSGVTMGDILKSVKTLDGPSYVLQKEKPGTFSKSDGNLKKFQPSSSLDDMKASCSDPVLTDSYLLRDFSEWKSEINDPVTPTKSLINDVPIDESQRSPVLLSIAGVHVDKSKATNREPPKNSADDKVFNSQSVISFGSLLSSQQLLEFSIKNSTPKDEKKVPLESKESLDPSLVSNNGNMENVETDQASTSIFSAAEIVDEEVSSQHKEKARLVHIKEVETAIENQEGKVNMCDKNTEYGEPLSSKDVSPSSINYSQKSFENEANAALSVFEVSDFLSCPKSRIANENSKSHFKSPKESLRFCGSLTPSVKVTGTAVSSFTRNKVVSISPDIKNTSNKETFQKISAGATLNTGFSKTFDENRLGIEESLNSVSQLQECKKLGNVSTQFQRRAETDLSSSSNPQGIEQSHDKKSLFTSASGKTMRISSENLRKAELIFEACNKDPQETSDNMPQIGLLAENVNPQDSASSDYKTSNPNPATDFITATGKNICVSQKSLNVASNLLESLDDGSKPGENSCKPHSSNIETTVIRSKSFNQQQFRKSLFNTASGKTMKVSSVNLQKAKSLLDNCSDDSSPLSETTCSKNTTTLIGETAGSSVGKHVCVADKSLNIASQKTIQDDVPRSLPANKSFGTIAARTTKVEHFRKSMFQSGNGKSTYVTSENLQKAKNLLDSLDEFSFDERSSSKAHVPCQGDDEKNNFKSNAESSDLCTPENTDLLDNDNELFQTIETPSKRKDAASGSSYVTYKDCSVTRDSKLASPCFDQNEDSVSSKAGLDMYLHCSQTVFNESGITTQRKTCDDGRHSTVASPKSKSLVAEQRSPVLLKGSFMGTPSPRKLSSGKSISFEGIGISSDTADRKSPYCVESPTSKKCKTNVRSSNNSSSPGSFNVGRNSNSPQKSLSTFFISSSGKTIETSVESLNKVRSLLSDLIDEEMDSQILSYVEQKDGTSQKGNSYHQSKFSTERIVGKLENIKYNRGILNETKTSPTKLDAINTSSAKFDHGISETPECQVPHFTSVSGKSIEVFEENPKRTKDMSRDVLDEGVGDSCGKVGENEMVDVLTEDELCSPVLLDGSFVENSGSVCLEAGKDEKKMFDSPQSPVLNCSFVAPEKQQQSNEKSAVKVVATPVVSARQSFEEKLSSSPDWGEFPDLKSSQAALLENQAEICVSEVTIKENIGLVANQQNNPEIPNMKMCESRQIKNDISSVPKKVSVALKKSTSEECGLVQKSTSEQLFLNSSLPEKKERLLDLEASRKRKSAPNFLQSATKKSKQSPSHQRPEDAPNRLATRKRIREQQCFAVRSKKNKKIQPSPGILATVKNTGCRWQLKDLDDEFKILKENHVDVGVSKMVFDITSENSTDYRFRYSNARAKTKNFFEGDLIADSCLVAYADDDTAGLMEVTTAFLTSPHVDPKLIPNGWIKNHYRWIVWKLACLERTFPQHFGGSGLTLENVLLQLKYRYDREIDMVHRPSFRKLLEGDAAPNKFICCVASVKKNNLDEGESLLELELTDGWYSIWAIIDQEMVDLVKREVVGIGTKLIVHGAELANCEQGCDPLNVPGNVKLKICTNSVRRVKWFAKMGFTSNNNPIPALLCSVLPNGGRIGQVTAVVARKYPVIYMCKDGDGKTVFRNERSQALYREQQEKIKSDKAEQVYEQVWKEVESKHRKSRKSSLKFTSKEIQNLTDPEMLFNIMDGSDTESIQSQLSAEQLNLVMQYKDNIMLKMKNDVEKVLQNKLSESEPASKVTKLLKVRLMDLFTDKSALLTIWRPSEDDMDVVREGKAYEFFNLVASGTRDRVLQLSSTRQTTYTCSETLQPSEDCARVLTPIQDVISSRFTPTFGEIDVVGVVVLVKLPEQSRGITVVYLSDLEGSYLSITFWTSLSVFGCEDLLTEGSIIGCSNLQWRPVSNQRKIPSVFASEITYFSLNPKENHLHQGVEELKANLAAKDVGELVSRARSQILQMTGLRELGSSPAPSTPPSSNRSTPGGTPAHKKLKLLNRMGEDAPPLSPMPLYVTTRHVFQNFKSPCRTPLGSGKSKQS